MVTMGPDYRGGIIHTSAGITRDNALADPVREQALIAAGNVGVRDDFSFLVFECGTFDPTCPFEMAEHHGHAFWKGRVR